MINVNDLPTPVDPRRFNFSSGITVVIPSIPTRRHTYLHRALDSVLQQELSPDAIIVEFDHDHTGAAATRNRGMKKATTEWTAFLDDDDEFLPEHLKLLRAHAMMTDADMVYPWFDVPRGFDPFPHAEGQPFNPAALEYENTIPVTVLIKTELIKSVGGFTPKGPPDNPCDDWGAWIKVRNAGAKIEHLNRRTWLWHWHSGNTSGRGDRW
jgi:glycosyltransferase involved in cell wall biosynthesis